MTFAWTKLYVLQWVGDQTVEMVLPQLGKLLPALCARASIQQFTNHDMSNAITMVSRSWSFQCKRTGHRRPEHPESLDAYITNDGQTARNKAARFQHSLTRHSVCPECRAIDETATA